MMRVLLVSTYELGRQPFGLASPAAWLRRAAFEVECVDVSRTRLRDEQIRRVGLVAFYLPMHTATRLAMPLIARVQQVNPDAALCAYGLYAALSTEYLRKAGVESVVGPECEEQLVAVAKKVRDRHVLPHSLLPSEDVADCHRDGDARRTANPSSALPRLKLIVPDRRGLPPLTKYASLELAPGQRRVVGYTEASRGCKHRCRHCPIVPVYDGQFRIVPVEVVVGDIAAQVEQGAQHVTFGDPDFFNGVTHARRVVTALARQCPGITYDVTIKIEHLLEHRDALGVLRDTGCLFVTTAVESIDDAVLGLLDKGHTREDFVEAVGLMRAIGLAISPTFVAFTPWTTLKSYCELLDTIEDLDLVGHVAPIQLAIRLLLPEGSRLLELPHVRALAGPLDPESLTHRWRHRDSGVDTLQRDVEAIVGVRLNGDRFAVFDQVSRLAHQRAGITRLSRTPLRSRATIPYLNEPWYC